MKTVLLYNFSGERLSQVKMAVTLSKAASRVVEKESFCQTLGYLIGAQGYEECKNRNDLLDHQHDLGCYHVYMGISGK